MKKTDKVKELIEKSGNNFHYQVVDFLKNNGWSVSISPYYNDYIYNKSREIDIVADKEFDVRESGFNKYKGALLVRLFIECKYINKETIFWFDIKDKERAVKRICRDTPLKPQEENVLINQHHYLQYDKVAKLFATHSDKAQDNEPMYKALTQSLNSMVYYRSGSPIIPKEKLKGHLLYKLRYPLIVCNGFKDFFKVDSTDNRGYSEIVDNFQIEINYAYIDRSKDAINEYFLIDVIDFIKLNIFLEGLEKTDIKIVSDILANLR